ncbi:hypothetical protein J3459_014733 [Metarhizium acridum]|uniref:DUF7136 domain-containing protein n=1 Tax=Metarhizium acridum (strain CQMa 102) TaxID=655827 RepID=E9DUE7_METAQ|nr:uncharacterized protein MAC_01245 [Metarhizium acridum CQMa 102]EFY92609.1 hypothetical protein MAC_01245 [Metarhizium acridum CQMa 102]KAG8412246.1 hypothetical protein J3458_014435 [Metarhizium acridum]KAG8414433.1 hypothetical protein J3459_014733 [Metarhizium acridum]
MDLVFPRANETYQRVYPFPIVFAIQSPAPVWPHSFQLLWQTGSVGEEPSRFDCNRLPVRRADLWTWGNYNGPKTMTMIYPAGVYINSTVEQWYFAWHITMLRNCTQGTNGVAKRPVAEGKIFFNVSHEGKTHDIFQGKESTVCPLPLWTVHIVHQADSHVVRNQSQYGDSTNTMCPDFDPDDAHPSPEPCKAKATEKLAQNVTREMLSTAKCASLHSWPNASLVGPCSDTNWESSLAPEMGSLMLGTEIPTAIILAIAFVLSVYIPQSCGFRG